MSMASEQVMDPHLIMALLNETSGWTPEMIGELFQSGSLLDPGSRTLEGEYIHTLEREDPLGRKIRKSMEGLDIQEARRKLQIMELGGVSVISYFDDEYPISLKNISDPPLIIFHSGTLFDLNNCVAISGTRHPDPGIEDVTRTLARILSGNGYTISSGLAMGVDTFAHEGTLDTEMGTTVGVIPSGLDNVVPRSNEKLAVRISERGAILSERFLRSKPAKYDFIKRNRIISGISLCQVIIQSRGKGGTQHQFNIARKQGKNIFVYTGMVLSHESRKNASRLLSNGAIGFDDPEDLPDLIKEGNSNASRKDLSLDRWS